MSTPYLGEIKVVSFNFAPKGWAFCNGQTMPINQNQALFSLLGTFYGGDGVTTFKLPNLQGASPIHMGSDANGNPFPLGGVGGEVTVTLTTAQMPAHTHRAQGVLVAADAASPAGTTWAKSTANPYGLHATAAMNATNVGPAGGSEPHNNMPPYLVLNFVIALQGIFPSRN